MKSYNQYRARSRINVNHKTGASSVTTGTTAVGDSFAVSGFGQNTGRKFIDPVPGEYQITRYVHPEGYTRERSWYSWAPDVLLSDTSKDGWHGDEFGDSLATFTSGYDPTTYNNALSDVYEGIRQSEINLAVAIGELHESGRMLMVGKSIYEVLLLARKARRKARHNPSLLFSELWLSWQYGWKPFLNEAYNALNWMYHAFDDGIPVRGRATRFERYSKSTTYTSYPKRVELTDIDRIWKAEVKLWVGLSDSTHYNLSRISSLNPLSIAWELVPLSFVCDWFLDIGGWLQNIESALASGVTFKRGYVTEICIQKGKSSVRFDEAENVGSPSFYRFQRTGSLKSSRYVAWKRRQKLTALPLPRAPKLEVKLGFQRIVSLVSLVRTVILGGIADDGVKTRIPRKRKPKYVWDDYPDRTRRPRKS